MSAPFPVDLDMNAFGGNLMPESRANDAAPSGRSPNNSELLAHGMFAIATSITIARRDVPCSTPARPARPHVHHEPLRARRGPPRLPRHRVPPVLSGSYRPC